jgi:hypothetical protein
MYHTQERDAAHSWERARAGPGRELPPPGRANEENGPRRRAGDAPDRRAASRLSGRAPRAARARPLPAVGRHWAPAPGARGVRRPRRPPPSPEDALARRRPRPKTPSPDAAGPMDRARAGRRRRPADATGAERRGSGHAARPAPHAPMRRPPDQRRGGAAHRRGRRADLRRPRALAGPTGARYDKPHGEVPRRQGGAGAGRRRPAAHAARTFALDGGRGPGHGGPGGPPGERSR